MALEMQEMRRTYRKVEIHSAVRARQKFKVLKLNM
jgi:hypothetical protein